MNIFKTFKEMGWRRQSMVVLSIMSIIGLVAWSFDSILVAIEYWRITLAFVAYATYRVFKAYFTNKKMRDGAYNRIIQALQDTPIALTTKELVKVVDHDNALIVTLKVLEQLIADERVEVLGAAGTEIRYRWSAS